MRAEDTAVLNSLLWYIAIYGKQKTYVSYTHTHICYSIKGYKNIRHTAREKKKKSISRLYDLC